MDNTLFFGHACYVRIRTCLLRTGPKVTKVINTIAALVDWHIPDRGGSRAAAISKMARFLIIVNGWEPLTIIAKRSILDVASALDPPLPDIQTSEKNYSYVERRNSTSSSWTNLETVSKMDMSIGTGHSLSLHFKTVYCAFYK